MRYGILTTAFFIGSLGIIYYVDNAYMALGIIVCLGIILLASYI